MKKIFMVMWLLLTGIAGAENYYVASVGSDGNTGLAGHPWKTFAKVCSFNFASGDVVSFNCGDRFTASVSFNKSNITVNSYGTGARPAIVGSRVTPFEISGVNVNFYGIKTVNGKCNFSLNGQNILIESCNIDSNASGVGYNGNPGAIYSGTSGKNITIRNSTINYNRGGNGYYIDGADNVILDHDTIMYNAQSGIRISWGTEDGGTSDGLIVRNCISRFNGADLSVSGYALEDDGVSNSIFDSNVFESGMDGWCGAFGLSAVGTAPFNNTYTNNTFITHGNGYAIQINNYAQIRNLAFKNNKFINDAGTYGLYFFGTTKPNNWAFSGNSYSGLSSMWHLNGDLNLTQWKAMGYDTEVVPPPATTIDPPGWVSATKIYYMQWEAVNEAAAYTVQVSLRSDFKTLLVNQDVTGTSFNYAVSGTGKRYVRVYAKDKNGKTSIASGVCVFTINTTTYYITPAQ